MSFLDNKNYMMVALFVSIALLMYLIDYRIKMVVNDKIQKNEEMRKKKINKMNQKKIKSSKPKQVDQQRRRQEEEQDLDSYIDPVEQYEHA